MELRNTQIDATAPESFGLSISLSNLCIYLVSFDPTMGTIQLDRREALPSLVARVLGDAVGRKQEPRRRVFQCLEAVPRHRHQVAARCWASRDEQLVHRNDERMLVLLRV